MVNLNINRILPNPKYKLKNKVEKRRYPNERSYAPLDLVKWPDPGRTNVVNAAFRGFVAIDGEAFAPLIFRRSPSPFITPRFPKYVKTESRQESATYVHEENTSHIHAKLKVT